MTNTLSALIFFCIACIVGLGLAGAAELVRYFVSRQVERRSKMLSQAMTDIESVRSTFKTSAK